MQPKHHAPLRGSSQAMTGIRTRVFSMMLPTGRYQTLRINTVIGCPMLMMMMMIKSNSAIVAKGQQDIDMSLFLS